jgi:hypothetical protein
LQIYHLATLPQTLIVDDREPYGKSWQYALGRLVVVDALINEFPAEFSGDDPRRRAFERTMTLADFGYRHLTRDRFDETTFWPKCFRTKIIRTNVHPQMSDKFSTQNSRYKFIRVLWTICLLYWLCFFKKPVKITITNKNLTK